MFRLRWKKSATDELAQIWMTADSEARRKITEASHQIEYLLQHDPEDKGESRPNGRRILFERPLAVLFKIVADQQAVRILQVWRY